MIYATLDIENSVWEKGYELICGVDEVGRGCFAGPVVTGAVVISPSCNFPQGIADSKLLKPKQREVLAEQIKECAVAWAVGISTVEEINSLGIGKATQLAFTKALENLTIPPEFILIDAFYINSVDKKIQQPITHGDQLSISIAAASIVAKVFRDDLMNQLHLEYPEYGFNQHKGYGTKVHQQAIKQYGLSEIHRKSFDLSRFF